MPVDQRMAGDSNLRLPTSLRVFSFFLEGDNLIVHGGSTSNK